MKELYERHGRTDPPLWETNHYALRCCYTNPAFGLIIVPTPSGLEVRPDLPHVTATYESPAIIPYPEAAPLIPKNIAKLFE